MNKYNKSDLAKMKKDELIDLIMSEIDDEKEVEQKNEEVIDLNIKELLRYKIGNNRGGVSIYVDDIRKALEALKTTLNSDYDKRVDTLIKCMRAETIARISTSQIEAIKKAGEQFVDKRLNQIFVTAYLEGYIR